MKRKARDQEHLSPQLPFLRALATNAAPFSITAQGWLVLEGPGGEPSTAANAVCSQQRGFAGLPGIGGLRAPGLAGRQGLSLDVQGHALAVRGRGEGGQAPAATAWALPACLSLPSSASLLSACPPACVAGPSSFLEAPSLLPGEVLARPQSPSSRLGACVLGLPP